MNEQNILTHTQTHTYIRTQTRCIPDTYSRQTTLAMNELLFGELSSSRCVGAVVTVRKESISLYMSSGVQFTLS